MATYQAPPRLTLGPDDHGRPVSADEFADADFLEPWRFERAEGRLIVMPPSGPGHRETAEPFRDHLGAYRLAHPDLVQLVCSEAWVRPDADGDRVGDIAVYLARNPPAPIPIDRVPDLMFEVVSPGKVARERDYIEKRAEYHKLGVREYVIVDRFAGTVTVLTYAIEGYDERVLRAADTYTSPLLPGLAVPLAEILGS